MPTILSLEVFCQNYPISQDFINVHTAGLAKDFFVERVSLVLSREVSGKERKDLGAERLNH